jgi:chitinase
MQQKNVKCQADEYPPAAFWQERSEKQYIRFSPGTQNEGAGSLFHLNFCRYGADNLLPSERQNLHAAGQRVYANIQRDVTEYKGVTTRRRVEIDFPGLVNPGDWGLHDNPCWPEHLLEDPGFALLTDDPYYVADRNAQRYGKANYPGKIPQDVLDEAHASGYASMDGYRKRDDKHALDPDAYVLNIGNSSRPLTEEELQKIGIIRCASADCEAEMGALAIESAPVVQPTQAAIVQAAAYATPTPVDLADRLIDTASAGSGSERFVAQQPRATGS